jgi:prepilin-type N-terminal cleavage/methylation domain-containing protein
MKSRHGLSFLELLAVIIILGVIAVLLVPRFAGTSATAKSQACAANRRNLEVQARLWYRTKGSWPATNLSDIAANTSFLPEGLPTCPVDGSAYTIDSTTRQISGHNH